MGFMQSPRSAALWTALQKEFPRLKKLSLASAEIGELLHLVEADRAALRRARVPAKWREESTHNLVNTYIDQTKDRRDALNLIRILGRDDD